MQERQVSLDRRQTALDSRVTEERSQGRARLRENSREAREGMEQVVSRLARDWQERMASRDQVQGKGRRGGGAGKEHFPQAAETSRQSFCLRLVAIEKEQVKLKKESFTTCYRESLMLFRVFSAWAQYYIMGTILTVFFGNPVRAFSFFWIGLLDSPLLGGVRLADHPRLEP